jgi:hypothetical protein
MAKFKYLEMTVTNHNLINEEIKSRLNSGNACYNSIQNLLYSRQLSKNVNIIIYKIIILLVVLHGCETWCLTSLRKEHSLRATRGSAATSYATSRKVAGSIPDEVIGFFN